MSIYFFSNYRVNSGLAVCYSRYKLINPVKLIFKEILINVNNFFIDYNSTTKMTENQKKILNLLYDKKNYDIKADNFFSNKINKEDLIICFSLDKYLKDYLNEKNVEIIELSELGIKRSDYKIDDYSSTKEKLRFENIKKLNYVEFELELLKLIFNKELKNQNEFLLSSIVKNSMNLKENLTGSKI